MPTLHPHFATMSRAHLKIEGNNTKITESHLQYFAFLKTHFKFQNPYLHLFQNKRSFMHFRLFFHEKSHQNP